MRFSSTTLKNSFVHKYNFCVFIRLHKLNYIFSLLLLSLEDKSRERELGEIESKSSGQTGPQANVFVAKTHLGSHDSEPLLDTTREDR